MKGVGGFLHKENYIIIEVRGNGKLFMRGKHLLYYAVFQFYYNAIFCPFLKEKFVYPKCNDFQVVYCFVYIL